MRTLTLTLACVVALATLSVATLPVQAQSFQNSTEESPLWEVHLHLQKSFASPLGQRLMAMVEKEDPEQLKDFVKFSEAIGLDPRTDIGEVVVFGDGFNETDVTLIANLGQSTGNLEGWILAAPGYRSEDLDSNTLLHSMTVEGQNARAWFALPKHPQSGNYVLIGSLDQGRTIKLARQVLAGSPSPIPNSLKGNTLLSFFVNDLSAVPIDIDEDKPGSAIVQIIEQIGLKVASDDDNLSVMLNIAASSAGKARQISQLLTGFKALIQLAPIDEPKLQKIGDVLESLVVSHNEGEPNVQASLSAPYRLLEELLNETD